MIISSISDQDRIDYEKPTFTFDVNVIALKPPSRWTNDMKGIAELECNYFMKRRVELCVTPETYSEILQDTPLNLVGSTAYSRFKKSELFKSRPTGTTLSLSDQEANATWAAIRSVLWPTVSDAALTRKNRADVTQIFFHYTASGTLTNSAFITRDNDFHMRHNELESQFNVQVMYPYEAWDTYQPKYNLYEPNQAEIENMLNNQRHYLDWQQAIRGTAIPNN